MNALLLEMEKLRAANVGLARATEHAECQCKALRVQNAKLLSVLRGALAVLERPDSMGRGGSAPDRCAAS